MTGRLHSRTSCHSSRERGTMLKMSARKGTYLRGHTDGNAWTHKCKPCRAAGVKHASTRKLRHTEREVRNTLMGKPKTR